MDRFGVFFTLGAYICWGLFPFYFHAINMVGAGEILAHRIVWSLVMVAGLLVILRRGRWIRDVFSKPKVLGLFMLSAFLIACNWGSYVYAIVSGQTIEASLGYFVNPLMSVALGAIFLGEKLTKPQLAAVVLATVGVMWITIQTGAAPFLGLFLAASFALYGFIRKVAPLGSLEGMALESVLLAPLALGYMAWLYAKGDFVFAGAGWDLKGLLLLSGPVTTIPLLLFASGVRRIPYSTVGIIQYVSPTIVFFIGIYAFGEPFSFDMFLGFVFIWTAVLVFTIDSLRRVGRVRNSVNEQAAKDS